MKNQILLENNLLSLTPKSGIFDKINNTVELGTVCANFAYYGYAPSGAVLTILNEYSKEQLVAFWETIKPELKKITGKDRKMGKYVVYKNFPQEVLEMSQAEYWLKQILMYVGFPNDFFTEEVKKRKKVTEKLTLKVLHLASSNALGSIYTNLIKNSSRWSDIQERQAIDLVKELKIVSINLSDFSFKENGVVLIKNYIDTEIDIEIANATDVLRLAAGLSDADVSLRVKGKFKKFSRPQRRFFLQKLEDAPNLEADISIRKEQWKVFLKALHPNDYKFTKVSKAYDKLYNDKLVTVNSITEQAIENQDASVLLNLQNQPGDFARRLHKLYAVYGLMALEYFVVVIPKLTTIQLVKLNKYFNTINNRQVLMYPPKGNWNKAQQKPNTKLKIKDIHVAYLTSALTQEISSRLNAKFPNGVNLDEDTRAIKLQTNDQKLANYGRGTVFKLPKNVNFLRTASYWEMKTAGNNWFDNGWNFFDNSWNPMGAICWNTTDHDDRAVFSGDPTNSKDLDGKACQMIDLYLDKLAAIGVRYAVWNILCFSHVTFAEAKEVFATLQWGDDANTGKLYEPSRVKMAFPLTGDTLTKYVAYIDIKNRELVYIDADLHANVQSAQHNCSHLSNAMPAYIEYLNSLPSVYDLFQGVKKGTTNICYSDESIEIKEGDAYVFQPSNQENTFNNINLSEITS